MSYFSRLEMLLGGRLDGTLRDERECIGYRDLPALLADVHYSFRLHGFAEAVCVGVRVENTVACVLMICSLLAKGMNFFLLAHDSPVHQEMPAFCDWVLSSAGINRNPRSPGQKGGIPASSGKVFFSSSGTTGKPKYVCFTRDRLLLNAENCVKRFGLTPASRVLVPVPVSHMYGMGVGLLPALLSGASVSLIEKNNIIKLLECIPAFQPTVTLLTPGVVKMMSLLKRSEDGVGSLFITAGEKIGRSAYKDFEAVYGTLLNLYGSTELGAIAVSAAEDNQRLDGVVRGLEGVEVRVAAGSQQLECRHGAGFETYVDELGMPYGSDPYIDGWFATRDAGRMESVSSFTVLGRTDNCINRSGFLVSLDEISALIEDACPEIGRVVVIESGEGIRVELTAVCELNPGENIAPEAIRQRLRKKVNRHQLPDSFCFVREMPKLPGGKPDRAFLLQHYRELSINKP